CGVGLGQKLKKRKKITLVFTGEGGTSEGDFHEALNLASVWNLPVIFLIENNGYGLSTPAYEQYHCETLARRAESYGMESKVVDGNHVLEVYETISSIAENIRKNPRPFLVEAITFRMRGHEEASGTWYIPQEYFEYWKKRDPLKNFEKALLEAQIISQKEIESFCRQIDEKIERAWQYAESLKFPAVTPEEEIQEVYPPFSMPITRSRGSSKKSMRMVDSLNQALHLAMEKDPYLVIMGQDIAEYGGVFKVTQGLMEKFGKERVRNTPICESAPAGATLGLGILGISSILEIQFADFVSCAFNQIINNLAKIHYRWGGFSRTVIRLPSGSGIGAGPFHSQSPEGWFIHVPGLKVVYPAFPQEAKGLLLRSLEDPAPVLFFEHKALYRSFREDVDQEYFTLPLGEAFVISEGEDITIITYGMGVHWALEARKKYPHISMEIVNLRTLLPWDKQKVEESVKKTGKAILLSEDTLTGGITAEIASHIQETCFEYLDGPVMRVASLDTPVPFASSLEKQYLPKERFEKKLLDLWSY
ncbi:MAG: dehydrogenase, partial [Planctomycetota bacterium]